MTTISVASGSWGDRLVVPVVTICPKAERAEKAYPEFQGCRVPHPKSMSTPQPRDPVRSRPLEVLCWPPLRYALSRRGIFLLRSLWPNSFRDFRRALGGRPPFLAFVFPNPGPEKKEPSEVLWVVK